MTRFRETILALAALGLTASTATAIQAPSTQTSPDHGRPPYSFLRQSEDWSEFRKATPPADPFDPLKHVDLSRDGEVWVSLGGRVEARFEGWRNFGFAPAGDNEFVLSRALLHADLHAGEHLRFFVEGKTAQATDRDLPGGRRTLDLDTLDLQQAFVDVVLPLGENTLTVRPGRQALLFGAQRLVSPLPWGNTLRTWDGVQADWRGARWTFTALATAFAPVQKTSFNDTDGDTTLYGLYASRPPQAGGHGLELYLLANERQGVTVNGTSGHEERQTLGGRAFGPLAARGDYELEAAWQTGEVGAGDVRAWFLAAQLGWRPEDSLGAPRLWLGVDLASGDDEPGGDVETFHQLFPLGHAFLGFADAVGRQNIADASLGGKWNLDAATSFATALHSFWVLDEDDALYNAGGVAYRSGFESHEVGMEIDLRVDHRIDRHTGVYGGYSHFFAGDALEQSGPSEDVDFFYLGLGFTF